MSLLIQRLCNVHNPSFPIFSDNVFLNIKVPPIDEDSNVGDDKRIYSGVFDKSIFSFPSKIDDDPSMNAKTMIQKLSYHNLLMCKIFNFMHPNCYRLTNNILF